MSTWCWCVSFSSLSRNKKLADAWGSRTPEQLPLANAPNPLINLTQYCKYWYQTGTTICTWGTQKNFPSTALKFCGKSCNSRVDRIYHLSLRMGNSFSPRRCDTKNASDPSCQGLPSFFVGSEPLLNTLHTSSSTVWRCFLWFKSRKQVMCQATVWKSTLWPERYKCSISRVRPFEE